MQDSAFHAGHKLDYGNVANIPDNPVDDVVTQVAMGHLATAEAEAGLHLVAALQEFDGLILLGLIVVLVHRDGELDLFDRDHFLLLAGGALGFLFLVEIAAVVLDSADGRDGIR